MLTQYLSIAIGCRHLQTPKMRVYISLRLGQSEKACFGKIINYIETLLILIKILFVIQNQPRGIIKAAGPLNYIREKFS